MTNNKTLHEYRGIPCHHWEDELPLIADVLRAHKPVRTYEIGTMYGGFALWMADIVKEWNGTVHTVDIVRYPEIEFVLNEATNVYFSAIDAIAAPHDVVPDSREPVHVYCDGGQKQREMELYAPRLYPGSLLGVHDFSTEVDGVWAEEFMHGLGYIPVERERFEEFNRGRNWVSRFWRRMS